MALTEGLGSQVGTALLRSLMTLVVAGLSCAGFSKLAQAGDLAAAAVSSAASATDVLITPGDGGKRTGLRSSVTLGASRSATDPRLPGRPSPDVASEPPRLRLQRSLAPEATPAGLTMKHALPGGELNREGIVRASRILVRDGTIVLESESKSYGETGAQIVRSPAPSVKDPLSVEARNQPAPKQGE
ncbi:MAG: hypothetical protein NDI91_06390 [Sulfuritalea sp.]|nr:hypothetical protein [Sulfuritalea sp.]